MQTRTRLLESPIGLIEMLGCNGPPESSLGGFSPDFQIAFPSRGVFVWHVGGDEVVGDPTQVLFIRGGEPFQVTDPRAAGYAECLITPALDVLRELTALDGRALDEHPLFSARCRRAPPALQRQCASLRHRADADLLEREEGMLALLRQALRIDPPRRIATARTRRLLRRAKEFLDAAFTHRLELSDVAAAIGASPAYLTDVFRRFEGISLQRYVTQLRLARALVELPHTNDLSALALDLGFCSHSHFTLAFRRAFDCTPSEWRATHRPQATRPATRWTRTRRARRALG